MHLSREILYAVIAFLIGNALGVVEGVCLFGGWLMGWILPATVPSHLANNDVLELKGEAPRSKVREELPFAGSDKYVFVRDSIGNVSYREKIPYAGDGEG